MAPPPSEKTAVAWQPSNREPRIVSSPDKCINPPPRAAPSAFSLVARAPVKVVLYNVMAVVAPSTYRAPPSASALEVCFAVALVSWNVTLVRVTDEPPHTARPPPTARAPLEKAPSTVTCVLTNITLVSLSSPAVAATEMPPPPAQPSKPSTPESSILTSMSSTAAPSLKRNAPPTRVAWHCDKRPERMTSTLDAPATDTQPPLRALPRVGETPSSASWPFTVSMLLRPPSSSTSPPSSSTFSPHSVTFWLMPTMIDSPPSRMDAVM